MIRMLVFTFFSMGIFSCTSSKNMPGKAGAEYIRFGNGGGFTGAVKAWYLMKNGSIWEETAAGPQKSGQADKEVTDQMFGIPSSIEAVRTSYNVPGNRYFFIEYKIGRDSHTLTWGGEPNVPPVFETWHRNLMHLTKKPNLNNPNIVE